MFVNVCKQSIWVDIVLVIADEQRANETLISIVGLRIFLRLVVNLSRQIAYIDRRSLSLYRHIKLLTMSQSKLFAMIHIPVVF